MEHQIKALAQAITHQKTAKLVLSHVKELILKDSHLIIHVDNTGPLHELSNQESDSHLRKGLEAVYGKDITYEVRLFPHQVPSHRPEGISDGTSTRRMSH